MTFRSLAVTLGLVASLWAIGCTAKSEKSDNPSVSDLPETVEPTGVPDDFRILAHYSPGYSPLMYWTTTISRDGKVQQKTNPGRGGGSSASKSSKLTKDEIDVLWNRVRDARFFQLKQDYRGRRTDSATLELEVTRDNVTRKVSVYDYDDLQNNDDRKDVKRFLDIWSEVVKLGSVAKSSFMVMRHQSRIDAQASQFLTK